jgi:putative transport protein
MNFTFSAATGIPFFMICLFGILAVGYLLGRVTIKGISLGSAGVFIMALLFSQKIPLLK